jgi:hypothetical protein
MVEATCRTCKYWNPKIWANHGWVGGKCFHCLKPEPPTYWREWHEVCSKWEPEDEQP